MQLNKNKINGKMIIQCLIIQMEIIIKINNINKIIKNIKNKKKRKKKRKRKKRKKRKVKRMVIDR